MMMATCSGSLGRTVVNAGHSGGSGRTLHLHDFLFLAVQRGIDVFYMRVGHFLELVAKLAMLVLADLVILLQFLERVHAIAAHIAHRDARGFGIFMCEFDKLFAAFFV